MAMTEQDRPTQISPWIRKVLKKSHLNLTSYQELITPTDLTHLIIILLFRSKCLPILDSTHKWGHGILCVLFHLIQYPPDSSMMLQMKSCFSCLRLYNTSPCIYKAPFLIRHLSIVTYIASIAWLARFIQRKWKWYLIEIAALPSSWQ